ncbi:MAG: deoxyguanosinetriphosphate triphosphohydrolase [Thermosulfidibacteraceae bacterium]
MSSTSEIKRDYLIYEDKFLHPKATKSSATRGRLKQEKPCWLRTEFQRDRDRIIHSKSFRRLKHKTQVFIAPAGDHYRTRLTHTLEVAQIARTIARALRLNEDLVEAISLGHDLGHTPFGHAGEKVLNELLTSGFHHAKQSLRVVDILENNGLGLNLTIEVRDGILKHTKGFGPILPSESEKPLTLEAEVVRISDIIAYVNHDLDDALRASLITEDEIPLVVKRVLGCTHSERINTLVASVIKRTIEVDYEYVSIENEVLEALEELRSFLVLRVYNHPFVLREVEKSEKVVRELFYYFMENEASIRSKWVDPEGKPEVKVADYISGMTDRFALKIYTELFVPSGWRRL